MLHNYPVIDEIVSAMNELGWDVYSFDHEDGNGQFETDLPTPMWCPWRTGWCSSG